MKPSYLKSALAAAFSFAVASTAQALTFADALGTVVSGEPASPASEIVYINHLLGMGLNSTDSLGGHNYTHFAIDTSSLPAAVTGGSTKDETGDNHVNVTGFLYLLGKYDGPNGGDYIWYVGNLSGAQTIPTTGFGRFDLSHWSLYNPGTSVPDGGTTMAMLGISLLGVEALRRKLKSV